MNRNKLIEEHLNIVHWTIHHYIQVNEHIFGFEYDDLYSEGCIHLCKAANTYDESKGKFSSYATSVIKNGLISYCRQILAKQKWQRLLLDEPSNDESITLKDKLISTENYDEILENIDVSNVFNDIKCRYGGITLKGIEALELKMKGYTGNEIAKIYNVKPNHIGAWIFRAVSKLKKDKVILELLVQE